MKKIENIKLAIVCSHGGHLEDVLAILEAFSGDEVFLISYDVPTLKDFQHFGIKRTYYIKYFGDSFIEIFCSLTLSCFTFFKIFFKERPQVIFSTGSEIAIPAFYIGKFIFHCKLIFLEDFTRVYEAAFTAKCVYFISDLFLVQHRSLLSVLGRKAKYSGSIL